VRDSVTSIEDRRNSLTDSKLGRWPALQSLGLYGNMRISNDGISGLTQLTSFTLHDFALIDSFGLEKLT
jgi:hypothetical protein